MLTIVPPCRRARAGRSRARGPAPSAARISPARTPAGSPTRPSSGTRRASMTPSASASGASPAPSRAAHSSAVTAARPSRTQASVLESVKRRPADEARLDAARARQRADLRAAAVHDADARLARHPRDLRARTSSAAFPPSLTTTRRRHVVYSALNETYSGESEDAYSSARPSPAARSMRISTSRLAQRRLRLAARAGHLDAAGDELSRADPDGDALGVEGDAARACARQHAAPVGVGAVQRAAHQDVLADRAHGRPRLVVVGGAGDRVVREARGALAVGDHLARDVEQRGREPAPERLGVGAARRHAAGPAREHHERVVGRLGAVDRDEVERRVGGAAQQLCEHVRLDDRVGGRGHDRGCHVGPDHARALAHHADPHVAAAQRDGGGARLGPGVGRADRVGGGRAAALGQLPGGARRCPARPPPSAAACRSRRSSRRRPRPARCRARERSRRPSRGRRPCPARRCRRWRCPS